MATLAFSVEADYDKVIKLREEIVRLEIELAKVSDNGTPEEIARLENQLASCRKEISDTVMTAAQLGSSIEENVSKKMAEASQSVAKVGEATQAALSGVNDMEFGTAQERIEALSYAIYNNEVMIADSIKQLELWRDEARQAFENGDTGTLQAITKDINEQITKIQEVTNETQEYRTALNGVLEASGISSGAETPVIRLFDSEKDIRHVEELQQKVIDLRAEIARVGADGGDTTALTRSLTDATDELNECKLKATETAQALGTDLGGRASEAQQRLYELNRAIEEQDDVIETLQAKVDDARDAFDTLSKSESASRDEVESASATYQKMSESLTQAQERMEMLKGQQQEAQLQWNAVNKEIQLHDSWIIKMCGGYENFNAAVSLLPAPLQSTVKGIMSMTSAAGKFILSPIGATIAAIALALQALYTWFNKSAEGQRAFAEISGYVSGVLGQLTEIVLKVGEAIFGAFKDPQKALKDFGKLLQDQVMNRLKGMGGMFKSLGKIMQDVFTGKWGDIGKEVKELGKQYAQTITGVENVVDKANKWLEDTNDKAQKQANIKVERQQLEMDESAFQEEKNRIEGEMIDLQTVYRDTSRSKAERQKALDQYKKFNEELTDTERQFAEKRLELVQRENELTTNPLEAKKREDEAKAQVLAVENQGKQRLAALTRTQASLNKADQQATAQAVKEAEKRQQALTKLEQEMLEMRDSNEKARIALMKEGSEKALAQIKADYDAQMTAINKQENELRSLNKKGGVETQENGLTQEQNEEIDKTRDIADKARIKAEQEVYDAEKDAMYNFLKEYGTYEQQRLAITEQYAKKIADAENVYERMNLTKERDTQLQELDMKFKDTTNWEEVFGSIDTHTDKYLRQLESKIRDMMKDPSLTAEEAEALGGRLVEVQTLLVERSGKWAECFGIANERQKVAQELSLKLAELEERRATAIEQQVEKEQELDELRQQIEDYVGEMGIEISINDIENIDELMGKMRGSNADDAQTKAVKDMVTQYGVLKAESNSLTNDIKKLDKSIDDTKDEQEQVTKGFKAFKEKMQDAASAFTYIGGQLSEGLEGISEMFGDDSGLGDTFGNLADGVNAGIDAFAAFESGDYVGAALSALNMLDSFGNALGIFGDSDKTLHDDVERLTLANEDLANAIEGLSGKISDSTTSLAEAYAEFERSMDDIAQMEANTQEMMSRSAAAYATGIFTGEHSSNKKINDAMTADDWERVSKAAGVSVRDAEDFWNLTSKQMYDVSLYATDLYSKIKQYADDGHEDAAQYMDEYIEYWQEMEDVTNTYFEKLTNTSFDSLTDSFKSAVSDMSKTAADFADDFEDMMKNAVIDSLMTSKYNQSLQKWYSDFAEAMESEGTLDAQEQQDLKDSYMQIVNDARNEIEGLYDTLGWSKSGYAQQGSAGGWNTMSEDTGQELNGRFTALQDIGVQMLTESKGQSEWLSRIHDINSEILPILANSYLELQMISENTANALTHLSAIEKTSKKVEQYTQKL